MPTPTITTPVGIDIPIQKLQNKLTAKLWTGLNYLSYGQSEIIEGVPKVYVPGTTNKNGEYIDMFLQDTIDAHSFFYVQPTETEEDGVHTAEVDLIFFVNLSKASDLLTRAKEEIIKEARGYLRGDPYGFKITGTTKGVTSLSDFSFERKVGKESGGFADNMQPYFVFKFTMELKYKLNNC